MGGGGRGTGWGGRGTGCGGRGTGCNTFYVLRLYGRFTLETILAVAFGRQVGVQRGEADDLTDAAMKVFRISQSRSGMMIPLVLSQFPFLEGLARYYGSRSPAAAAYNHLQKTAIELVRARRAMGHHQKEVRRREKEWGGGASPCRHLAHVHTHLHTHTPCL